MKHHEWNRRQSNFYGPVTSWGTTWEGEAEGEVTAQALAQPVSTSARHAGTNDLRPATCDLLPATNS
ncbi:hypothetical protein GQX73_g4065 [Xylaria multiplex]|uniref:Uncharacterized protein n=1 Tax=Xylaria multiplex TaxID=323545 RepID=A0A7C8IT18_9PEZI|nr:hypothetical protein GQX73_g4065 [Xylaria multiplex]